MGQQGDGVTWRAFAGQWGGADERNHIDVSGLTWELARGALLDYLRPYLTDECADCKQAGTEAIGELDALTAESTWRGEVDGEDLLLLPS